MSAECGTRLLYVGPVILFVNDIQDFLLTSTGISDIRDIEGEWD